MLVTFSQRLTAIFITLSCFLLLRRLLQSHYSYSRPLPNAFTRKYHFSQPPSSASLSTVGKDDGGAATADSDYTPSDADEPPPRIRQVTILDTTQNPKILALQEQAVETHKRHGQRWGYPTDVKRRGASRQEGGEILVKAMYMRSVIMGEMTKKAEKRAEWIL